MAKLPRRKCANKECRQWFHPIREGQIVCSYQCASAVGKEQTRKAREAAQRKAQSLQRAAEKKERAAGHLRFTRFNIHLQCDVCNVYKSGNIEAYRAALVERYGEAAVLALENNNTTHRWTVEELKEIRLAALADLRALKKLEAA
ncbi:recombination protein NinG [Salmonella enterica]